MVPDPSPSNQLLSRRKFLVSGVAVSTVGLAGCAESLAAKDGLASPTSQAGWSTASENVAVTGQPTTDEGVPVAWGAIAHTPEEAQNLIDWNALRNTTHGTPEAPSDLREFDAETDFVTVIVGVLPYGKGLKGLNKEELDAHFEENMVRYEVTSYQALTSNSDSSQKDDPENPEYWYDYSISLWNGNGVQAPTTIEVSYQK